MPAFLVLWSAQEPTQGREQAAVLGGYQCVSTLTLEHKVWEKKKGRISQGKDGTMGAEKGGTLIASCLQSLYASQEGRARGGIVAAWWDQEPSCAHPAFPCPPMELKRMTTGG